MRRRSTMHSFNGAIGVGLAVVAIFYLGLFVVGALP